MQSSVINSKGTEATTYDDTLKAAGFNWKPLEEDVVGARTGAVMPRKKMLVRSDTKEALGIVGLDYVPTDPAEFLRTQYDYAAAIGGKVIRAGWVDRRAKAFSIIQLEKQLVMPKGLRKKGDPMAVFLYSTDGWDGGTPRTSSLYIERLACLNGMVTRQLEQTLWVSHTRNTNERYAVAWKEFSEEVETKTQEFLGTFINLAKARMSDSEAKEFLGKLMPGEGEKAEEKRQTVFGLFKEGVGNEGLSRWDAYNAVTEYVTHHRTYKDTKIAQASTNRFLGVLERNAMSERAMQLLSN